MQRFRLLSFTPLLSLTASAFLGIPAVAPTLQAAEPSDRSSQAAPFDHTHAALAPVLKAAVVEEGVRYAQVKSHLPALKEYLDRLARVPLNQLATFTREQRLAFWINGYNAHVLQVVAEAYPLKSIKDIPGVFSSHTFVLASRPLTLDKLENEVIRPQFKEPRIHFALNCAARSCPALQPEPFQATKLDAQLEAAAAAFVKDSRHNRVSTAEKVVYLSRLFEWFGNDFVEKYGDRTPRAGLTPAQGASLNFIGRYLGEKGRALVQTGTPKVGYFEYDWSLNSR